MDQKNYRDISDEDADVQEISHHVAQILRILGDDIDREGLKKTPMRVAKAYKFLTSGSMKESEIEQVIKSAEFTSGYDEMVIVKDIEFYSLCEHHLLPFYGRVHVAYIPNGKVIGLSKIPRLIEIFARRLQVQEQMTGQIRDALQKYLAPEGVAVVIEAHHMCMMVRGVQKHQSTTIISAFSGRFLSEQKKRDEFMAQVRPN